MWLLIVVCELIFQGDLSENMLHGVDELCPGVAIAWALPSHCQGLLDHSLCAPVPRSHGKNRQCTQACSVFRPLPLPPPHPEPGLHLPLPGRPSEATTRASTFYGGLTQRPLPKALRPCPSPWKPQTLHVHQQLMPRDVSSSSWFSKFSSCLAPRISLGASLYLLGFC